jgi:hypothetical protein
MNNTISLIETDLLNSKVQMIMRQTDYTEEIVREKLKYFNFNEMDVIKDYLGIKPKKEKQINSVNQTIYKEIRKHLDGSLEDYHKRVENGEVKKVV